MKYGQLLFEVYFNPFRSLSIMSGAFQFHHNNRFTFFWKSNNAFSTVSRQNYIEIWFWNLQENRTRQIVFFVKERGERYTIGRWIHKIICLIRRQKLTWSMMYIIRKDILNKMWNFDAYLGAKNFIVSFFFGRGHLKIWEEGQIYLLSHQQAENQNPLRWYCDDQYEEEIPYRFILSIHHCRRSYWDNFYSLK